MQMVSSLLGGQDKPMKWDILFQHKYWTKMEVSHIIIKIRHGSNSPLDVDGGDGKR
jgi:hypothetical protein